MPGSEEGRSFFLAIASGRWNSSGKTGRGFSAMKRRIPSGIRFDKAGGMARHGRDAIRADDGLLGLAGSEGSVGGAGTRTTPGGSTEAARQPACFVVIAGRRGRETILSDMRSVMLRLGDAPPGKADVLPDFQQGLPRPLPGREDVSEPCGLSPRGERERSRMSGRPQAAKKPSMRRASSFPMADRLPGLSSGGRTVMSATGHACRTV